MTGGFDLNRGNRHPPTEDRPSRPPLGSLAPFERFAVRLVRRMNRGRWRRFWFWFQCNLAARWMGRVLGTRLEVHGLEHVAATSRERPLLVVANHRTFFDLYAVMTVLFRRTTGWQAINFPVRGRFFFQSPVGLLVNCLAAWWSMYPPFFHTPKKRRFDQYAFRVLVALCHEGRGRLVGFHPEGTRNKGADPYALLPPQPGVGRLIIAARPQVVPVFVAGLSNSALHELRGLWGGGEPVRVWFGPPLALSDYLSLPDNADTYRLVADATMAAIGDLAEADAENWGQRS